MNKHLSSTKLLIMYDYLICCKLTFSLQRNNKLHIFNIHYYKLIFQNFIFKLNFNIYRHEENLNNT